MNIINWLEESDRINRLPHIVELTRKCNDLNQAEVKARRELWAAFAAEVEKVKAREGLVEIR